MGMKDKIIIVLTIAMLILGVVLIADRANSSSNYDPWLDVNGDGRIDLRDIAEEASLYGSTGDPTRTLIVKKASMTVSFAINKPINDSETHTYKVDSSGYNRICLAGNLSTGHVIIHCSYIVAEIAYDYGKCELYDWTPEGHHLLVGDQVMGDHVRFTVTGNGVYSLGIYAGLY